MLSKSKIKLVKSLSQKKNRDEAGLFIAEGTKLVTDLSVAYKCSLLIVTDQWLQMNGTIQADEIVEVASDELKQISNQKSPQGVLAVFRKHEFLLKVEDLTSKLSLALDDVQDPGNLGTIIRIADWFGIKDVICSLHSADAYGPKTVQATMGALARVKVHYVDLTSFLSDCKELPIYGTFMDGESIYDKELSATGIIVMGNEGNGISDSVRNLVSEKLLLPNYPFGEHTSESLNVGVATALVCGEFRRRMLV
jgi:RNA methyltransferase, TrmH family